MTTAPQIDYVVYGKIADVEAEYALFDGAVEWAKGEGFRYADADGIFGVRNTGSDNVAKTLHERELEVQRVLHSPQFEALARAA